MEQPVPSDRIEETLNAIGEWTYGYYNRDHAKSALIAHESAIREQAMADLQELKEAARTAYDYIDQHRHGKAKETLAAVLREVKG